MRPFLRDAIIKLIYEKYFFSKRPSQNPPLAAVFASGFTSSVRLAPHKKEIPAPVLALACANVSGHVTSTRWLAHSNARTL